MAKLGELDDAPGLVLVAIIFGIFGFYLLIFNKRPKISKSKKKNN